MEEKKITMEYMLLHVIGHWGSIIKVSIISEKLFFLKKQNELLYYVTIKTLNSTLWLRKFEHFYFVLMLTSLDILLPQADLGLLQHSR